MIRLAVGPGPLLSELIGLVFSLCLGTAFILIDRFSPSMPRGFTRLLLGASLMATPMTVILLDSAFSLVVKLIVSTLALSIAIEAFFIAIGGVRWLSGQPHE